MMKSILSAATASIALGTIVGATAAQAQMMQPAAAPTGYYSTTSTNAVITGEPQPDADDMTQGYVQPAPMPQPGVSPRTTWIPGHYDWDPSISNYRYIEGQFVEAPRENAQWMPGHWTQTPTSWIWIEGGWN